MPPPSPLANDPLNPDGAAIAHVVWDWNGTLFDDAAAMVDSTIEAFAAVGLPPVTADHCRRSHTQPISDYYTALAGRALPGDVHTALNAAFDAAYARRRPALALAADALDCLDLVAGRGTQSLLSMHPHDRLMALVDRFGIAGRFARVDGQRGSDAGRKARHLAEHLGALGTGGAGVLLIGDSVDDARAAAAAGARCVLVASGLHTVEALRAERVPVGSTLSEALAMGFAEGAVR
ncbi:phosphoglycolate phosphatase-like HAD superfamily hydrolase [Murinocardiopsis flavida]|uniref:Phosphoglycolate phosphatase-like HAD superfamily hydrolase n=1 Tax=Murinocardiopsis flavida TaxID=645275 RepID=A0A2P8CVG3_9ACTN|nr:HAD hydrolase-like protein [Murinocardiopsis flavida]PSK88958.1 phosphoglycolate phosphatase-like HAD superfamily hydrolase [Murinocardiopsis flavida]